MVQNARPTKRKTMDEIRFLHESYFYSQHSNIFFYKQLKNHRKTHELQRRK